MVLPDTTLIATPAPLSATLAPKPVSLREFLRVAAGIALAIAVLPLLGAGVLWTRPLWMDEVVTTFILSEASPAAMVDIIGRGGDWNPPLLHFMLWPIAKIWHAAPTVLLRTFAVVCTGFALLLVYVALRRKAGPAGAIAGMIAIAAHPIVIQQAFEGRFYAPWLLFAAGFAWALGLDAERDRSLRRDIAIGVFAALLCTIHWFGVFSMGVMAAGAAAVSGRSWRSGVRLVSPAVLGVIALAVCAPLALSQRASATGLLWVRPLTFAQFTAMAKLYWFAIPLFPVGLVFVAMIVRRVRELGIVSPRLSFAADRSFVALAATAFMPVVLVALSIVLQPSMVDRYAIVAALAWAPLLAFAIDAGNRVVRVAGLAFLAIQLANGVAFSTGARAAYADETAKYANAYVLAATPQAKVVFVRLHSIYPVAGLERGSASARYLALPDSTIHAMFPSERLGWLRANMRLDRDQALYHSRIFGFPNVMSQAQLDTTASFILLAGDLNLPGGYKQAELWGSIIFPSHRVTRMSETLSMFERVPAASTRSR